MRTCRVTVQLACMSMPLALPLTLPLEAKNGTRLQGWGIRGTTQGTRNKKTIRLRFCLRHERVIDLFSPLHRGDQTDLCPTTDDEPQISCCVCKLEGVGGVCHDKRTYVIYASWTQPSPSAQTTSRTRTSKKLLAFIQDKIDELVVPLQNPAHCAQSVVSREVKY
jgi:hypothetical protein